VVLVWLRWQEKGHPTEGPSEHLPHLLTQYLHAWACASQGCGGRLHGHGQCAWALGQHATLAHAACMVKMARDRQVIQSILFLTRFLYTLLPTVRTHLLQGLDSCSADTKVRPVAHC
jgi:hypothetical protein